MSFYSSTKAPSFYTDSRHYTGVGMYQEGESTTVDPKDSCGFCSKNGALVWHQGPCPLIKEIEYHPNGTIKKVIYR